MIPSEVSLITWRTDGPRDPPGCSLTSSWPRIRSRSLAYPPPSPPVPSTQGEPLSGPGKRE